MSDRVVPRLNKWPFVIGDVLLVGLAAVMVLSGPSPLSVRQGLICLAAVLAGASLCVLPFLREYQAALKSLETDALADTVAQIGNLQHINTQIQTATSQWQGVQEQSAQTVKAAKEIADRVQGELAQFCEFLKKAQDTERNHLRLEVDKQRGVERDWLQATVLILDHVYALHAAGSRSGQPALVAQLGQFQLACRDAVRRVGLVAFAPAVNDAFDPQGHQLDKEDVTPDPKARIAQVLALGYTYRGELVRRALVRIEVSDNNLIV